MDDHHDHAQHVVDQWAAVRPELDASPVLVIGRLHRVALALTTELVKVYNAHGLGEGDFDVLATLRRTGEPYELTPTQLMDQTMVTSGAVTKRLDRLGAGAHRPRGTRALRQRGTPARAPDDHRTGDARPPARQARGTPRGLTGQAREAT